MTQDARIEAARARAAERHHVVEVDGMAGCSCGAGLGECETLRLLEALAAADAVTTLPDEELEAIKQRQPAHRLGKPDVDRVSLTVAERDALFVALQEAQDALRGLVTAIDCSPGAADWQADSPEYAHAVAVLGGTDETGPTDG